MKANKEDSRCYQNSPDPMPTTSVVLGVFNIVRASSGRFRLVKSFFARPIAAIRSIGLFLFQHYAHTPGVHSSAISVSNKKNSGISFSHSRFSALKTPAVELSMTNFLGGTLTLNKPFNVCDDGKSISPYVDTVKLALH